jgi:hypothetical protein
MTQQAPGPTNVTIDPAALQKVLDAIKGLTDTIAGRSARRDEREPTADQARVILDYELLSQVLGRPDRTVTFVNATRKQSVITFTDPLPDKVTQVAVTPRRGRPETVPIDLSKNVATLRQTPVDQPLIRVELQTAAEVPVAFCPRLPAG